MASDFPFDCVGFDLDGTLVDSAGDIAASVNAALAAIGRAAWPVDAVRPLIGGGSRVLLERVLATTGDDETIDHIYPILLDYYDAHMTDLTRPYPQAVEALDDLLARGVTLAVVTNKREAFAVKLLDQLNLAHRFACVIGGDSPGVAAPKPDRAPIDLMLRRCGATRAAFVGDSTYDVRAAQAAGLPVLVFADSADTFGADAGFSAYDALIPTLQRIASARAS